MPDTQTYIADDATALLPSPATQDWESYDGLLSDTESALRRLFAEASSAGTAAGYAVATADGSLEEAQNAVEALRSSLRLLQYHADQVAAQTLPITGGQYTHLVTEDFANSDVRDTVTAYEKEPLDIQVPQRSIAVALSGLRWEMPCTPAAEGEVGGIHTFIGICGDPPDFSTQIEGPPNGVFDVTLHFQGAIETRIYPDVPNDGAFWSFGQDGESASNACNIYKMVISDPPQVYYLNTSQANTPQAGPIFIIDYVKTVRMNTGAQVSLITRSMDGVEGYNDSKVIPGVQPALPHGQFVQMDVVKVKSLTPGSRPIYPCPTRPPLEIDPLKRSLRLRRESLASVLTGLPTDDDAEITVEAVHGSRVWPVSPEDEGLWKLRVASPSALTASDASPWLPSTYEGGVAVRLRSRLNTPTAVTELRLRGALLGTNAASRLLETVMVVDSRPDVNNPASPPSRALSLNGEFSGFWPWTDLTPGLPGPLLLTADDVTPVSGVRLEGILGQRLTTVPQGGHVVLRYRNFCPYNDLSSPGSVWQGGGTGLPNPVPAERSFVQVYYYASASDTVGVTSPLGRETFRDEVPSQGGLYDGVASYTHLLTIPPGTQAIWLIIGTDPITGQGVSASQSGAVTGYADVWITDEAVTRLWDHDLPRPSESNLPGPGNQAGFVSEDAVDHLTVPLGNDRGSLAVSDVWFTLGQNVPQFSEASLWTYEAPARRDGRLSPYALSLPAESPNARGSRDPLLLYQARYDGSGPGAADVSRERLGSGVSVHMDRNWRRLDSPNGLPAAVVSRSAPRWKRLSRRWGSQDLLWQGIAGRFPTLYRALIGLSKSRGVPVSSVHRALSGAFPPPAPTDDTYLYVYETGLSDVSLVRQEYAPSGLYVTLPLQTLDQSASAVPGEIHEIAVMTDPPLPQLGGRVRLWVSPAGSDPSSDTAAQILRGAVPLDSRRPRATFHSAAEALPGLPPATSDVCERLGIPPPAFYITPSIHRQTVEEGLSPDDVVSGLRLDKVPYVNREAILRIAQAIAGADQPNPTVYDPNAVRPIIDFLSAFDSGFQPGSGSRLFGNDTEPHVIPSTRSKVALPFRDALGTPIAVPASPLSYDAQFSTDTSFLPEVPTLENDGAGTLSAVFLSPAAEGDYVFDVTLVLPSLPATGTAAAVPEGRYVCHVQFNVKKPVADQLAYVTGYPPFAVRMKLPTGRLVPPDSLGKPRPGEVVFEPLEVLQESTDLQVRNLPANPEIYAHTAPDNSPESMRTQQVVNRSYVTQHHPIAAGAQGAALELYWHKSDEFDAAQGGVVTRFDVKIPPSDYEVNAHTGQITVFAQQPHGMTDYDTVIARYFWRVGDVAVREWFPPPSIYDLVPHDGDPLDFKGSGEDTRPLTTLPVLSGSQTVDSGEIVTASHFENTTSWVRLNPNENNTSGTGYDQRFNDSPFSGGHTLSLSSLTLAHADMPYIGPGVYHLSLTGHQWADGGEVLSATVEVYHDAYTPDNVLETYGPVEITFTNQTPGGGHDPGPSAYQTWPTDTAFGGTAVDDATIEFVTVASETSVKPRKIRITVQCANLHTSTFYGVTLAEVSLTATTQLPTYNYPEGYDHNGRRIARNEESEVTATVSGGQDAGVVYPVSPADLLRGPIQQSYPVTRNVTNYASDEPAPLRKSNFDPESPEYYPVFEYRIDPGGVLRFADDFSTVGPFAGTKIVVEYDYLDVNPRIIVEMLPLGQGPLTHPSTPTGSNAYRPQVSTPEIASLQLMINARY